ncbi:nutrient deprivation-induced protein [Rhizobium tubonense]|uniref:Nutrient deprivation-induced protein n=1 Tax=Rhizobium tubonense TaxID=484088 RepID=A0A2W4F699_9HYPH|nr:nutrient deprivation-induced protein [Rhizobium tubonense]
METTTRQQPLPTVNDLKSKVSDDLGTAKQTLKDGAESAMDQVGERVSEQKHFAAHQIAGIATALKNVGTELENGDQADVGRFAKQIGENVKTLADNLEGRDLREIANMAEDFGRMQPLAFLGVAALAGLAASRFLTASSKRSPTSGARQKSDVQAGSALTRPAIGLGGQYNG